MNKLLKKKFRLRIEATFESLIGKVPDQKASQLLADIFLLVSVKQPHWMAHS